jgi:hypothetical protein
VMLVGDTGFEPVTSSVSGNGTWSVAVRGYPISLQLQAPVQPRTFANAPGSSFVGVQVGVRKLPERGLTDAHRATLMVSAL